jgi:methyl coenzyme M reductase gamma subunit
MDLERIANDSGMLVVMDGRIGREEYKSVHGSLEALQRFANFVRDLAASETSAARIDQAPECLV